MSFEDTFKSKAKNSPATIVFPEGHDERVLDAGNIGYKLGMTIGAGGPFSDTV